MMQLLETNEEQFGNVSAWPGYEAANDHRERLK
jgi:hypothetical protein